MIVKFVKEEYTDPDWALESAICYSNQTGGKLVVGDDIITVETNHIPREKKVRNYAKR